MALRLRAEQVANPGLSAPAISGAEERPDLPEQAGDQQAEQPADDPAVLDELLIEEVSIDGMCGVY